jgi:hypothetical protein
MPRENNRGTCNVDQSESVARSMRNPQVYTQPWPYYSDTGRWQLTGAVEEGPDHRTLSGGGNSDPCLCGGDSCPTAQYVKRTKPSAYTGGFYCVPKWSTFLKSYF